MTNNKICVGRSSDCQIVVDSKYDSVSNNHAVIEYLDGKYNNYLINKSQAFLFFILISNRSGIYVHD